MKVIVKQLQGGECSVEVEPNTRIYEIKQVIQRKLAIPMEEQKLLLLGRTLVDEQTVDAYPSIKDGTKLNLIVKKPEGFYDVSVRHFKKMGMNNNDAVCAASRLTRTIRNKFNKLSWDDIERLSLDCLLDEDTRPPIETESEADDMFNLVATHQCSKCMQKQNIDLCLCSKCFLRFLVKKHFYLAICIATLDLNPYISATYKSHIQELNEKLENEDEKIH